MTTKVAIDERFMIWFERTNAHLFNKKIKTLERQREVEEYVNDVLMEHIGTMDELLDDDSPDSGWIEE